MSNSGEPGAPRALKGSAEHLRPQAHFTARDTWFNDPNGLLRHNGIYHMFFQNNPYGNVWGNMSWGHATSRDLVNWEEQPVAIPADDQEAIFSGSAVVDSRNTAGFAADGETALVAIYTSAYTEQSPRSGTQAQSLAYSLDDGLTWQKYTGNPVLDESKSDFRDPKVFWHGDDDGRWIMVVAEAVDRQIAIYSSVNLKEWSLESRFGPAHATGGVWECPDLFPVKVRGSEEERWVLIVSLNPGGIAGGSGSQYFIGDFDGTRFIPDRVSESGDLEEYHWLDYGRDYYAAVSFSNVPQRRLTLGWASNWDYANSTPTHPWRSAMSLVRELELVRGRDGGLRLTQTPVLPPEEQGVRVERLWLPAGRGAEHEVRLATASGWGGEVILRFDGDRRIVTCDRRGSGDVGFDSSFPCVDTAPLLGEAETTEVMIIVDGCVLEVYLDGGLSTITQLVFPDHPLSTVAVTERAAEALGGSVTED